MVLNGDLVGQTFEDDNFIFTVNDIQILKADESDNHSDSTILSFCYTMINKKEAAKVYKTGYWIFSISAEQESSDAEDSNLDHCITPDKQLLKVNAVNLNRDETSYGSSNFDLNDTESI